LQAADQVGANIPTDDNHAEIRRFGDGDRRGGVLNGVVAYVRLSHIYNLSMTLRVQASGAGWSI
jgi:hypothetical protein